MRITHYRINAVDLWEYVESIPPKQRGKAFLEFASCLLKNTKLFSDFTDSLISDAEKYIQQKQRAGKASAQRRSCSVATPLERTPNAPSSNIHNIKEINKENIPYAKIISHTNQILSTNYRPVESNNKHIRARWNEGFREEDFYKVCQNMKEAWGDDVKMMQYLRPETLFGTKMDSYLNRSKPPERLIY